MIYLVSFIIVLYMYIFYLWIRNYMVRSYIVNLTEKCFRVCDRHLHSIDVFSLSPEQIERKIKENDHYKAIWDDIENTVSYNKLLFSLKPLEDKYWLTPEQIKWLEQYDTM